MEQIRVKLKMYAYRLHIELWKESLNSDGQQFHQYQQNEQIIEHKKSTTYGIRNPCPGLWWAQKSGRVKPVDEIPTLPSW
jgi:hypothetical protein